MNTKIYNYNIKIYNYNYRFGFHIHKEATIFKTFADVLFTPYRVYQIYIFNPRSWSIPNIPSQDLIDARIILKHYLKKAYIHGSLIYNLVGSTDRNDPEIDNKLKVIILKLSMELDVGVMLDTGTVVHIGSCKDKAFGINSIVKTIEKTLKCETDQTKKYAKASGLDILSFISKRKIILENSAGEGTKLGSTLDEIATIINKVDPKLRKQIRVCIDTAHIFGAGKYDLSTIEGIDSMFDDMDRLIPGRVELFHLNDSKVQFGSKKDRHEDLCQGYIFKGNEASLKHIVERCKERKICHIGEPPDGRDDYNTLNRICEMDT